MIISKIRLHMEKEAPEDIFRRLFSKITIVTMTNKQGLYPHGHNSDKQDLYHNIFFITKILRYVSRFPNCFFRLKLNSLYRE